MTTPMRLTGAAIALCLGALMGPELVAAAWAAEAPGEEVSTPVTLQTWRLVSEPVPRYVHVSPAARTPVL